MYGRSWKLDQKQAEEIRRFLIKYGGKEENITNPYEVWRIRLRGSTFIFYSSGKLYSTSSKEVEDVWNAIEATYSEKGEVRDFIIGFDEAGKGELFGPLITCGVLLGREKFSYISSELKTPDTKKSHSWAYWERILSSINSYLSDSFLYSIDLIEPREIDRFNINHLLDLSYIKLIKHILSYTSSKNVRIAIDNYGIGEGFQRFLDSLIREKEFEIKVVSNAEEEFFEVKLASLIAKAYREKVLLNLAKYYKIPEDIIKGNLGNNKVLAYIENYEFRDSWFVRKSFGLKKKKEKSSFVNLVSREGKIRCFFCNKELDFVFLENFRFMCSNCGTELRDLDLAFKYFNGVIKGEEVNYEILLKILKYSHIFDGYKLVLPLSLKDFFLFYEEIGRISILSENESYKEYLKLHTDKDRVILSFFRKI